MNSLPVQPLDADAIVNLSVLFVPVPICPGTAGSEEQQVDASIAHIP